MPDRLDSLVLRRILPSLSFLRAIKSNHDKAILGCLSFNAFNLAARDEEMGAVGLQRVRNLGSIFCEGRGVVDVNSRDHVTRPSLLLRVYNHRAREANHD